MMVNLYEKNQGQKKDNKLSADEFFEAATTQNIFHLMDDHFFNVGQNIDKSINSLVCLVTLSSIEYTEVSIILCVIFFFISSLHPVFFKNVAHCIIVSFDNKYSLRCL